MQCSDLRLLEEVADLASLRRVGNEFILARNFNDAVQNDNDAGLSNKSLT
ncbi:MAG: hypothetical protein HC899_13195 [Leptolyngbyaceae cyanobacterium SM1_4_3]|nr:hypothetical protein [Leptolyngbyaceae cyanobacterium SM1_4_3]